MHENICATVSYSLIFSFFEFSLYFYEYLCYTFLYISQAPNALE